MVALLGGGFKFFKFSPGLAVKVDGHALGLLELILEGFQVSFAQWRQAKVYLSLKLKLLEKHLGLFGEQSGSGLCLHFRPQPSFSRTQPIEKSAYQTKRLLSQPMGVGGRMAISLNCS